MGEEPERRGDDREGEFRDNRESGETAWISDREYVFPVSVSNPAPGERIFPDGDRVCEGMADGREDRGGVRGSTTRDDDDDDDVFPPFLREEEDEEEEEDFRWEARVGPDVDEWDPTETCGSSKQGAVVSFASETALAAPEDIPCAVRNSAPSACMMGCMSWR